jgi:hypothetical protein
MAYLAWVAVRPSEVSAADLMECKEVIARLLAQYRSVTVDKQPGPTT